MPNPTAFSETNAWRRIGDGWRRLHGSFRDLGYSIEWHDFHAQSDLDWARSFHPRCVEICLNLAGSGTVQASHRKVSFAPLTAGFYLQDQPRLRATRLAGQQHQFITIELSFEFLRKHIDRGEPNLHPRLASIFRDKPQPQVADPVPLTRDHQQMILALRQPPVHAAAQRLWYHAKALETASALLYDASPASELFCQRQKRINQERVRRVIELLEKNLAEPPDLPELGRLVGCSHFHLSRIFSQEMGRGIYQYLRDLRMQRAATLLRQGQRKVTDIALEVGYASPSHFSTAFHETFGCCPGLFPLKTTSQRTPDSTRD